MIYYYSINCVKRVIINLKFINLWHILNIIMQINTIFFYKEQYLVALLGNKTNTIAYPVRLIRYLSVRIKFSNIFLEKQMYEQRDSIRIISFRVSSF